MKITKGGLKLKETRYYKDRKCLRCIHFFECKTGKKENAECLNFVERSEGKDKKDNG